MEAASVLISAEWSVAEKKHTCSRSAPPCCAPEGQARNNWVVAEAHAGGGGTGGGGGGGGMAGAAKLIGEAKSRQACPLK